jgi:hypothetical protein
MRFYFLDVADAGVSGGSINWTLIAVLFLTILIEAAIMLLMKYNRFRKALTDSLVVNTASIAAGFILFRMAPDLFDGYSISNLLILFAVTTVIEFVVLYLLNRKLAVAKTLQAAVVMNLVSYIFFFLFLSIRLE